jgi:hypothetical protein
VTQPQGNLLITLPDGVTLPVLPGALCADAPDPDLWYSAQPSRRAAAIRICRACPVIARCGQWADAAGVTSGIWGGRPYTPSWHGHAAADR